MLRLCLIAGILMAIAGCSHQPADNEPAVGTDHGPMEASPSQVVQTVLDLLAAADVDAARLHVVRAERDDDFGDFSRVPVTIVGETIDGDEAVVTTQTSEGKARVVCRREDGVWRVSIRTGN